MIYHGLPLYLGQRNESEDYRCPWKMKTEMTMTKSSWYPGLVVPDSADAVRKQNIRCSVAELVGFLSSLQIQMWALTILEVKKFRAYALGLYP